MKIQNIFVKFVIVFIFLVFIFDMFSPSRSPQSELEAAGQTRGYGQHIEAMKAQMQALEAAGQPATRGYGRRLERLASRWIWLNYKISKLVK